MPSVLAEQSLYVMQNELGLVKIGRSINPKSRLRTLEATEGCRIRLVLVREREGHREEEIHIKLDDHRLAGEWFGGTGKALALIEAIVSPETPLSWPFDFDAARAEVWLDGFCDRQNLRGVAREISRYHSALTQIDVSSWVWDERISRLHWLIEIGTIPSGEVSTGQDGQVVVTLSIDGRDWVVPRYTTDIAAAMSLWPELERPSQWTGSVIDCCKAALDARRLRWAKRNGIRSIRFKRARA